jgi:hypothetical protein
MDDTVMSIPRFSVYDGRELVAVLEHKTDGWHVIIEDRKIGVTADRVAALRLIDTHAMKKDPSYV